MDGKSAVLAATHDLIDVNRKKYATTRMNNALKTTILV
jgi:hypothetical protein